MKRSAEKAMFAGKGSKRKLSSSIIGSTKSTGFQMNCPRCGRRRAGSFSKRGNICHCNN